MYKKVSLLSAYISVHKIGVTCLSKTYLSSETTFYYNNLKIHGYDFIREDHRSNSGRVCVYYKDWLPFKVINTKYLQKKILFSIFLYLGFFQEHSRFT